MAIEVKLPNLGEGVDTGDVLELLVKEGDIVAKDQGIMELETGKATLQVPSSAAGKVSKIHVRAGQTIPPGTLLVTLEGTEAASKPKEQKSEAAKAEVPKQAAAKPTAPKPAPAATAPPKQESAPVPPPPAQAPKSKIENPKSAPPAPSSEHTEAVPEPTHDGGGVAAGPAV